jgi:formylglycine-generating enzyme required for sulfatase activity
VPLSVAADHPLFTIRPPVPSFAQYIVSFENALYTHDPLPPLTSETSEDVTLEEGVWAITAKAYLNVDDAEGDYVAIGSSQVMIVHGERIDCTIQLELATEHGTGTFAWNISFSPSGTADKAVEAHSSFKLVPYSGVGTMYTIPFTELSEGSIPVDAGYYLMELELGDGDNSAYRSDIVHIAQGLTATATYTFRPIDFISVFTVYRPASGDFYATLKDAVDAASGTAEAPDLIYLIENIDTLDLMGANSITLTNKHIKLLPAPDGGDTIKRWAGNTGALFTVQAGASLTLEGTATDSLFIDGGTVWTGGDPDWLDAGNPPDPAHGATNSSGITANAQLIMVNGTLTMNAGAVLQNNYRINDSNDGTVYVSGSSARFYMTGGSIKNNQTYKGGSGVMLDYSALFEMSGSAIISGNYISSAHDGGGVQAQRNSTFRLSENASISGNKVSRNGGGIRLDAAVFEMSGGTVSNNTAVTGVGGGISLVNNEGKFTMTGGTISGNTATSDGAGVNVSYASGGFFKMSGTARIAADNDVYLNTDTTITLTGALTNTSTVATITPDSYATTRQVLDGAGDLLTANHTKFDVTQQTAGTNYWVVGSNGYLALPAGEETTVTIGGLPAFNMRYVPPTPAGGFQRDATASNVTIITRGYLMGETEVTQELFQAVMGTNPGYFSGSPADGETQVKRPVEMVSSYDAIAFCNKLSLRDGRTPVYSVSGISDWAAFAYSAIPTTNNAAWNAAAITARADGYRLPTEMEWMWASIGATLGGADVTTTGYLKGYAGSTEGSSQTNVGDYAWHPVNSDNMTHEGGKKTANELGLFDMSGNVFEWCWDWYDSYPSGTQTDYTGAVSGTIRVIRGGSWNADGDYLRSAKRNQTAPSNRYNNLGFRFVRGGQ